MFIMNQKLLNKRSNLVVLISVRKVSYVSLVVVNNAGSSLVYILSVAAG